MQPTAVAGQVRGPRERNWSGLSLVPGLSPSHAFGDLDGFGFGDCDGLGRAGCGVTGAGPPGTAPPPGPTDRSDWPGGKADGAGWGSNRGDRVGTGGAEGGGEVPAAA